MTIGNVVRHSVMNRPQTLDLVLARLGFERPCLLDHPSDHQTIRQDSSRFDQIDKASAAGPPPRRSAARSPPFSPASRRSAAPGTQSAGGGPGGGAEADLLGDHPQGFDVADTFLGLGDGEEDDQHSGVLRGVPSASVGQGWSQEPEMSGPADGVVPAAGVELPVDAPHL